eukprot:s1701_g12.t1
MLDFPWVRSVEDKRGENGRFHRQRRCAESSRSTRSVRKKAPTDSHSAATEQAKDAASPAQCSLRRRWWTLRSGAAVVNSTTSCQYFVIFSAAVAHHRLVSPFGTAHAVRVNHRMQGVVAGVDIAA